MPNIISNAMMKTTKAPAIAKELISKPMTFNNLSPKNKKESIIPVATMVAFSDSIFPNFFLKLTKIGIEPIASIMANKTKKHVIISSNEIDSSID